MQLGKQLKRLQASLKKKKNPSFSRIHTHNCAVLHFSALSTELTSGSSEHWDWPIMALNSIQMVGPFLFNSLQNNIDTSDPVHANKFLYNVHINYCYYIANVANWEIYPLDCSVEPFGMSILGLVIKVSPR